MLEAEGIIVTFQNVNLQEPVVSAGVRVRISEHDLPMALRIIEAPHIFCSADISRQEDSHSVLVPVDFRPYSMVAAEHAIRIAAIHKADVCLLHSYIDPNEESAMQLSASLNYNVGIDEEERSRLESDATAMLDKFTAQLRAKMKSGELPPVKLICKVVEGVPEDSIIEYARINPPLLVVMGTRASREKEQELIGSVTAEVLDQCQNTVLAIPDGNQSDGTHISQVVFFTNLEQEDLLAIDVLCRVFITDKPRICLVSIPPKKRLKLLRNATHDLESLAEYCRAHYPGCTFSTDTVDLSKISTDARLLEKIVSDYNPDLMVIPNKRKNAFTRLFSPSLAHRVLFSTDTPVLAIPV